ncbi:hypothetical protein J3R82DRAFT_8284 [Butyriboletus roseoflavus]|nr:hypothetical protein J3R82DRAFT_8284 [Butyriboletus roseoflavus]
MFLDCIIQATEVEVDNEGLLKILSRYPGTFDVLRELIQNADDAVARNIQIHFQTKEHEESRHASELDVSKVKIHKWIIKNDGNGFGEKDWKRIGEIASGNDDSRKVGAFGVGFYSVLSKSDRPLVRSNGKSLQFDKGKDGKVSPRIPGGYILTIRNQLCKWPADCPMDSWTSIELELRKPEPLPMLADLTRFLVSSVAFLTHIDTFSVNLDSQRVLRVEKQVESSAEIPIPEHLKPTTPQEALTVESIQRTAQRITVDAKESAFASSLTSSTPVVGNDDALLPQASEADRPTHSSQGADAILKDSTITHDLYTANTSVNLGPESEMRKGVVSSMKQLPSDFKCKAVYFNSEQYDSLASIKNSDSPEAKHLARLLFGSQGIIPENDRHGQSTNQTTGIGLHISAHFLPTMERGSIDLTNGQVAAWNKEVLFVSGFLARVIYEQEMNAAKSKGGPSTQLGLRTMARFAFGYTTPDNGVSKILEEAFFSSRDEPKSPFPVVSDVGILCLSDPQFRQSNKELLFLKTYRVLDEHVESRQRSEIISKHKIPLFKFDDIVREFRSGVTQNAMKQFFIWWDDLHKNPRSSTEETRNKFCRKFASQSVVLSSPGVRKALKTIERFTFFPLPNDLSPPNNIYVEVTQVPTKEAIECFEWTQLSLLEWLEYACSQARQPASSEGSDQVSDVGYRILRVLIQFALVENLSPQQWDEAAELMKDLKCIPTGTDMELQLPADSYFDEAAVCRSLPVAMERSFLDIPLTPVAIEGGFDHRLTTLVHVHKVLSNIHVHEMMDWDDMVRRFCRLSVDATEESNFRLLQYVINHIEELTEPQKGDLKKKKVFYSKGVGQVSATDVLFPDEDTLELGLPILALSQSDITSLQGVTTSSSYAMETVIKSLGIQKHPTLENIIDKATSDTPEVRRPALQYLLANLETRYNDYKPENFANKAFIPTKCESHARLDEVFRSSIWEKLGFKQPPDNMSRDLSRLGVKEDPTVDRIIECFKNPERRPSDIDSAATLFEHLQANGYLTVPGLGEQLSTIPFVPVKIRSDSSSTFGHMSPKDCFIKSEKTMKDHHCDLFPIVDFRQNGNGFLEFCRAKKSLDASDIVGKILESPQEYLKVVGDDTDLYVEDLRTIASRLDSISKDDKQKMKKAPMFLAFRNGVAADELLPAEQVPISDWAGGDFAGNVFVAPKDDILEKMYREMGSVSLGTYVRHDIVPKPLKAECKLPFDRTKVILCIRCFMNQRDESGKTDVSFYREDESTINFRLKPCKYVKMKKTFAPPYGVLADDARPFRTKPTRKLAGVEIGETDESYTLWMVSCCKDPVKLRNDIAVALCHVLLKTYGPRDVLLLASLFATSDKSLQEEYKVQRPNLPDAQGDIFDNGICRFKSNLFLIEESHKTEESWRTRVKKMVGREKPGRPTNPGDETTNDNEKAMASWGIDPNPDFRSPCQSPPSNPKHNHECKQDYDARKLQQILQYGEAKIKFFMACGAELPPNLENKMERFVGVVSRLATVFGLKVPTTCYIFWDDTDEDLMAFNSKHFIYLNLAHYYNSCE